MSKKSTNTLRWAGAITMLLLIAMLIVEGTWAIGLYHCWPFVITVIVATVLLMFSAVRDLCAHRFTPLFCHFGLALVLLGGMLGAIVTTDCKIVVDGYASERVAYADNDTPVVLPFSLRLAEFHVDYYDNGISPKQLTSYLILTPAKGSFSTEQKRGNCSVNHPLRHHGWWIYQSDYDHTHGDFVILQLVRDPWLPCVYAGFVLMLLGTILQLRHTWGSWHVVPVVILVAGIFTWISLYRIEVRTLVPVLRSIWFFPHILIYMVAYSLMAITLILSIYSLIQRHCMHQTKWSVSDLFIHRLSTTTSSLLLIGMLCGSVWAKEAWGQYWTWDAKECWAAITWMLMVVESHIPINKRSFKIILLALAFAAMQITWYGVNYLPSAQYSLHTYTTK